MDEERELIFVGRCYEDLLSLPASAQRQIGFDLGRLQLGEEPRDWKPMKSIGPGVREIRVQDESGAYRAIYIAKFEEGIYALHCFEKKSQKTSIADLKTATARYRSILRGRV